MQIPGFHSQYSIWTHKELQGQQKAGIWVYARCARDIKYHVSANCLPLDMTFYIHILDKFV